ncbi:hypothetical protein AB1K32_05010 [Metabacillus dongyingensis]|uniref:hypothetical protein n=1 Tax=Metabacillus dongyingensis TaxID=2874282 RepID=UPI003B8E97C2
MKTFFLNSLGITLFYQFEASQSFDASRKRNFHMALGKSIVLELRLQKWNLKLLLENESNPILILKGAARLPFEPIERTFVYGLKEGK